MVMASRERPSDLYRSGGRTERVEDRRAEREPRTAGGPAASDDERREVELRRAVHDAATTLTRSAAAVLAAATSIEDEAREAAGAARGRADHARDTHLKLVREERDRALFASRSRVRDVEHRLAATTALESWQSNAWFEAAPDGLDAPSAVRVGELRPRHADGVPIALLVPLLNTGNVVLCASGGARGEADAVIQGTALRLLAGTGAGQLGVVTFDPALRGPLAALRELRSASTELFPPPASTAAELEAILSAATRDVARVREMLGGRHATLGEMRAAARQPIEGYQLIVLLDFPTNVSQESFDLLERLMTRGPACGTSFLIQVDPAAAMPRERRLESLLAPAVVLSGDGTGWAAPRLPAFDVALDEAPPLEIQAAVLARVAAGARKGSAPSIPFRELVPIDAVRWESSADRIVATIGRAGIEPVTITLGDEIEQRHNVLVAGAVGQGKSNLLLTLIHSLAARYGPDDLEMYLLDFKEGLEFDQLGSGPGRPHWLPQARVLGLESDREFGVAVLDHLLGEFTRRAATMKPHGNNIARFRAARPDERMPRILAVIDEFQVLLAEDDELADRALQALETLARKGRAYGIHLVLASQTLSGIQKLAVAEGSIFGQFPTRIALKTSANESQVVLANLNTEASRLRYRGEAIVNHDFGSPDGNARVTIAHAAERDLDALRARLWRRRPAGNAEPLLFFGNRPAPLVVATGHQPMAFVGMPVSVAQHPVGIAFADEPGRHLAIVGDGETRAPQGPADPHSTHMAFGAIHGATRSLANTAGEGGAEFLILDFLSADQRERAHLDMLATALRATSAVRVAAGPAATDALANLDAVLARRVTAADGPALYVVALGLHRAPGLDRPREDRGPTALETLRELVRSGPVKGMHLLGWWGSARAYADHINYEVDGMIDGLLALKIPASDATTLFGPFTAWRPRDHRGLLIDRANFAAPLAIVPFAPMDGASR